MVQKTRREFLKLAGLSAIGASLGNKTFPQSSPLEKIVLLCIDDFQSGWLEDIQTQLVQTHMDNSIPTSLGIIPRDIEEPLLTKVKEWKDNPVIEISQHDYSHDMPLIGKDYPFQYNYLKQGTDLFHSWGIFPKSFVPANSEADETTISVLRGLGFHTFYDNGDFNIAPNTNPFVIINQLMLTRNNEEGSASEFKDYSQLKSEIDAKIATQNGFVLVLYHMQDFDNGHGTMNTAKLNQLITYTSNLKNEGYKLATVNQYWKHKFQTKARTWKLYN